MRRNRHVINTAVGPLVAVVCCRKQEVGRVTDSWLGVLVCCVGSSEGELEGASWVLWLDGAAHGDARTLKNLLSLLPVLMNPSYGLEGGEGDAWLEQQICNKREVIG